MSQVSDVLETIEQSLRKTRLSLLSYGTAALIVSAVKTLALQVEKHERELIAMRPGPAGRIDTGIVTEPER